MSDSFWLRPLAATMFMQVAASILSQGLWVLAPVLTDAAGVAAERIGELSALVSLGSVWFLMSGGPLLQRLGSIRMLQLGCIVISLSLIVYVVPFWPLMMLAALLNGIGYGPTPPAGSDILARYSPPQLKATIFSIKQAGAPLGGAIAGAALPALTVLIGWQGALIAVALFGLAIVPVIQPLRTLVDGTSRATHAVTVRSLFSPSNIARPFRAVRLAASLPWLTAAAVCFAVIQGNLFTFMVTYLTIEDRFDLAAAGFAYAVMQIAGMFGRVLMGWIADRVGSVVRTLTVLSLTTTAMSLAVSAIAPDWPWLLVLCATALTGIASTSWNGIYLAEVAHLAPEGRIGEATSGSVFFTFLGYTFGPVGFSALVSAVGSYSASFALTSCLGLVATAMLVTAHARRRS
ncbi:MAG: MFS transporter [Proteobacteria bacterium]|nr:MFS transporter [Pseudomonadota bacterium]MBI3505655.1 MFS transporter [Pseudomonadota bacterium]